MKQRKSLVLYHADCPDGFGAAFAAWLTLGDSADYVPLRYNTPEHRDVQRLAEACGGIVDREVFLLDFSLATKAAMYELFDAARSLVWLDHHKTAFEMWCGDWSPGKRSARCVAGEFTWVLDDSQSGAMLTWHWFHHSEPPRLIQHIDDYDRWQFKIEGTKAFNRVLRSRQPWSFAHWQGLLDDNCDWPALYREGEALLRAHDQQVAQAVQGAARGCEVWQTRVGQGYRKMLGRGLAANCPPDLASDVGTALAERSGTFGLVWHLGKNSDLKCQCSLRSRGDYDVSAIAKAFGGGGHKNAAGFEVPIGTLLEWLQ